MATDKQKHLRIVRPQSTFDEKAFKFTLNDINFGSGEQSKYLGPAHNQRSSGFRDETEYSRLWGDEKNKDSIIRRTGLPYIRLTEFEPDMAFKLAQHFKVVARTLDMAGAATAQMVNNATIFLSAFKDNPLKLEDVTTGDKAQSDVATTGLAEQFFIAENGENSYNEQVFMNPIRMYRSFFNGKYIRSFELPYTDDTFLNADGDSGWNTNTDINFPFLNDFLSSIWSTVTNLGIIDLPPIPRWNWDGTGESDYFNVTTEFHLNNNNFDNLLRNFRFMVNLVQGPFWVQYNSRQYPPNIYSVEIPGVVFLQYATMHVNIESKGNRRSVPPERMREFKSSVYSGEFIENILQKDGDVYFPDVWEVKVNLRSLVPNNFNNYMNYLLRPYDDLDVSIGASVDNGQNASEITTESEG